MTPAEPGPQITRVRLASGSTVAGQERSPPLLAAFVEQRCRRANEITANRIGHGFLLRVALEQGHAPAATLTSISASFRVPSTAACLAREPGGDHGDGFVDAVRGRSHHDGEPCKRRRSTSLDVTPPVSVIQQVGLHAAVDHRDRPKCIMPALNPGGPRNEHSDKNRSNRPS